ncbi:MAG: tRNA (adenosine(37)-N6)-dimethylallyltransferase MiaA [Planctomycetes bacterium]|nr:tRNA (adenosine(37)-N6)-dimethylallyltransferase MiaA [Planctomycetota bacterium]
MAGRLNDSEPDCQDKPLLRIIVGSTASGKERLALACAERLGGEIISVDSMKVYRRLDIATAKAGPEERARIRHHCLDLVEPEQTFSAADFVAAADSAIADISRRGAVPLLSGGTAFYYKALLEGLFDGPGADLELRRELEARAAEEGGDKLHAELTAIDPAAAAKIHPADIRRLVRALEVAAITGGAISGKQTQWAGFHAGEAGQRYFANPRYRFSMIRLVRSRDDIRSRIRTRVDRMVAVGLEQEARWVFENRAVISRTPLQAVGYKEFFPYFTGESSWSEAVEKLCLATNKLVRSQDTWFRKFPAVEVIAEPGMGEDELADAACGVLGDVTGSEN